MKDNTKIIVDGFSAFYGQTEVLKKIELSIFSQERLAIIGPSNSGKSTFLRSLNRLNDLHRHFSYTGKIVFDGKDIYDPQVNVPSLRRRIGMVYAVPAPLPCSIYDNIAYGPKVSGIRSRSQLDELVEFGLKNAFLWDEVKDRLHQPASNLSGGQQQRMCLARSLALQPEVLLLDEPCSGLDPISTAKIEDALLELKSSYAIVLVTNNTKQAARASDRTVFFLMGQLIEVGQTGQLFTTPADKRTEAYITGQFG
jgi:phosphate transport system ATP-binding protein